MLIGTGNVVILFILEETYLDVHYSVNLVLVFVFVLFVAWIGAGGFFF